jgi:dsRNA-specific ribonuclease
VQVGGVPLGVGKGSNKKAAEQNAASFALSHLQSQDQAAAQQTL